MVRRSFVRFVTCTLLVAAVLGFAPVGAHAGLRHAAWVRQTAAHLADAAPMPDGGVVAVGTIRWRYQQSGVQVRRYGPGGGLLWSRRWHPVPSGGLASTTDAWEPTVAVADDGTIFVVGSVRASCEPDGWFVRSYGPQGRLRWTRQMAGWRHCRNATRGTGVAVRDGLVVVSAYHHGCCSDPYADAFLMVFTTSGGLRRTIDIEPTRVPANERVHDVAIGALGTIYVTGSADMHLVTSGEQRVDRELYVQKLSASGSVIWTRILRDRGTPDSDAGWTVAVRGNELVVGASLDRASWRDQISWVGRFSFGGQLLWSRDMPYVAAYAEEVSVAIGQSGGIYLAAPPGGYPTLRKYTPGGAEVWRARPGLGSPTRWVGIGGLAATVHGVFAAARTLNGGRLWFYRR